MKLFVGANTFKKTTLMFLASKLPERFFEDLRKTFIQIDQNGDGKIEEEEFVKALSGVDDIEFSRDEIKELMHALDTNQSGCIDYTEFLAGCMKSKIYLNRDHLMQAFEYFDVVIHFFIT
jgi:calcium-dependent protein kinase